MIRVATKRLLRTRYDFACGYCGVREDAVGAELTYDHFQPVSKGGTDDPANLVYACHACNEHKGDYYGGTDGDRLLHPLHDDISAVCMVNATGLMETRTALAALFVARLNLNRAPLIARRRNALQADAIERRQQEEMENQREILRLVRALRIG